MEMMRPSGLMRRERKTSPETTWRALARWQKSTSIKLSPIVLMLGIFQFGGRKGLDDRVECDFGFGSALTQQAGDLLGGLQAVLDDLLRLADHLGLADRRLRDVLQDTAHYAVLFNGENPRVQDRLLVAEVPIQNILTALEHGVEQVGKRHDLAQHDVFQERGHRRRGC